MLQVRLLKSTQDISDMLCYNISIVIWLSAKTMKFSLQSYSDDISIIKAKVQSHLVPICLFQLLDSSFAAREQTLSIKIFKGQFARKSKKKKKKRKKERKKETKKKKKKK